GVLVTHGAPKSFIVSGGCRGGRAPARRTLGDANKLPLSEARQRAREWLDLVTRGIDPKAQAREAALAAQRARTTTFAAVAEAWFADDDDFCGGRGSLVCR